MNSRIRAGVWIWGAIGALLGAAIILVIATGKPLDVYKRITETSPAVGAIMAATALAWTWFFQMSIKLAETEKISNVDKKLELILNEIKKRGGEDNTPAL